MSLTTPSSKVDYAGNGTTTVFPVPFPFFVGADLVVQDLDALGNPTTKSLGADYSVGGVNSDGSATTAGQVNMSVAPAAGHTLRIRRVLALTQPTSFRSQGTFAPSVHEAALDRLAMQVQQLNDGAVVAATQFGGGAAAADASTVLAAGSTVARTLAARFGAVANVMDFGAKGDGVTNDWAAFKAAHDSLVDGTDAWRGGIIEIPRGKYLLNQTWEITKRVHIVGAGKGSQNTNAATLLIFPQDTTGIRVYSSLESPNGNSGSYTRIEGLQVYCATKHTAGHGIWASGVVYVDHVQVSNFAQHGIYIAADAAGGTGNANGWSIRDSDASNCGGNGLFVVGPDVNAGVADNFGAHGNAGWGIYDDAYLTASYKNCLVEASGKGSYKSDGGSTTFDNCYVEANGSWGTEFASGTIVIGGNLDTEHQYPFITITGDGVGARAIVNGVTGGNAIGSVLVLDQGSGYTAATAAVAGGSGSGAVLTPVIAGGKVVSITITAGGANYVGDVRSPELMPAGAEGGFRMNRLDVFNWAKTCSRETHVLLAGRADMLLSLSAYSGHGVQPSLLDALAWNEGAQCFESAFNAAFGRGLRYVYDLTTTETGGRSGPLQGGSLELPNGIWIGSGANGRWLYADTAAPSSGEHAVGDLVLNRAPTAGAPWGWRCITAGTPGTWQALYPRGSSPTATKTADYTVTLQDAGTVFSNSGAGAQVNFTLPACTAGLEFEFMVETAQNVKITATGGATIRNAATASAANGHADNATVGGVVRIRANPAGTSWLVESAIGTWTVT